MSGRKSWYKYQMELNEGMLEKATRETCCPQCFSTDTVVSVEHESRAARCDIIEPSAFCGCNRCGHRWVE